MMNCKEATQLMSQGLDRHLSFRERLRLRLHLLICRGCEATEKHFAFLRSATDAWRIQHDLPSTQQGDKS